MSKDKRVGSFWYHIKEHMILHFFEPMDSDISFALGVGLAVAGPVVIGASILFAYGSAFWILGVLVITVGSIVVYGLVGIVVAFVSGILDALSSNRGMSIRVSTRTVKRISRGHVGMSI